MDSNNFDSPLKNILNAPVKRITPAVPVPDWDISSPGRPISSPAIIRPQPSPLAVRNTSTIIRHTSTHYLSSPSTSKGFFFPRNNISASSSDSDSSEINSENKTDISRTNLEPNTCSVNTKSNESLEKPTATPTRISGDVSFTPTHSAFTPHSIGSSQNPHSSIVPHTPVTSGPEQAKSSIKIQNCVSTVNLSCELKLLDIYCRTRFSEYNPSRFHGVVMRILEPRATALIFRSGKLVCTGAKNEHDSLLAARKFARIIQKLGYPVVFTEFKIQNFVATADLRFPIRLEALQQAHGQFTSYEPELFPGLIYRLVRPRIVLLIFVNGKIVFTGGKSRNDIIESLNIIYPILKSFKKN